LRSSIYFSSYFHILIYVMDLFFGGAYANIQTRKNPLTYFTIVAFNKKYLELFKNIPKKEYFKSIFEGENNFFNLTNLKKHITQIENYGCSSTITLNKDYKENVGTNIFYLDGLKLAIEKLFSENVNLTPYNTNLINIRIPVDPLDDFKPINIKLIQASHDISKYNIKFQHKNYSVDVECARLVSWYAHVTDMIKNEYYLTKQFKTNKFLEFRVLKSYSIESPPLEEYYSYYIGNPYLSFSGKGGQLDIEIEIGKKIRLCFICKVCSGILKQDKISSEDREAFEDFFQIT